MSQFFTKDRRHKEASLQDITSVVAGPPARYKKDGADGENIIDSKCLTINFKRGGGIDLVFKSEADRNLWFTTVKKIIAQNVVE